MSDKKIMRCAIYTRKSTEEGLDMEFNTLDAQREAGEKYIESQRHEGWRVIPELYDDGGFSGGNMDRPALKRLMADIKAGRIDIVVVYKIDRLSRSLADFAQMVQVFDEHNTSFVSVTQHFNTKDSMGRLTLNILLSFAQFEREVTGERIRDKFASSKKKGMWMGGTPPLGYDVIERKLITNPKEVKQLKHIYERFVKLGSVAMLASELNKDGYRTKSYKNQAGEIKGGKVFSLNALRLILKNRLYLAEVHHKGKYYPGQHQAIIPQALFDKAQAIFAESPTKKRARTVKAKSTSLLKGIIVCGGCAGAMSPTYTKKKNKIYRYYITNSYRMSTCGECPVSRIPAGEIEELISSQLKAIFTTPQILVEVWRKISRKDKSFKEVDLHDSLQKLGSFWEHLFPAEQRRITHLLIKRVVVKSNGVDIEYRASGFENIIHELQQTITQNTQERKI